MDIFISPEPGHLAFGVVPGVLANKLYGALQVIFAIEVSEQFFISDRLQAIEMAERINGLGLLEQSVVHHLRDAGVDALVQLLARARERDLDSVPDAQGWTDRLSPNMPDQGAVPPVGATKVRGSCSFQLPQHESPEGLPAGRPSRCRRRRRTTSNHPS